MDKATAQHPAGSPLSLAPGEHTVEVILGRYRDGEWLGDTATRSNRLTIEAAGGSK